LPCPACTGSPRCSSAGSPAPPHYGYSIDQLDYYLDEFTFRFNRRTARSRGLLFYRLLQQAVATDPHPYRELTTAASLDHYLWP
jgi:hypothetical protein